MEDNVLFPSLYEDDYIIRSLGTIVSQPDIALTELVANAWDAGATNVYISIPENNNQILYVEDDGVGMSEEEFTQHWMKLRYNRLKNQGRDVIFPDGVNNKRIAFLNDLVVKVCQKARDEHGMSQHKDVGKESQSLI
jgi:hypothetical protein